MRGYFALVQAKGVMDGTIYLEVPNDLTRSQIEQRGRVHLLDAIATTPAAGEVKNFAIVVNPNAEPTPEPDVRVYDDAVAPESALDQVAQAHRGATYDDQFADLSTSYPQVDAPPRPAAEHPLAAPPQAVQQPAQGLDVAPYHDPVATPPNGDSRLNPKYIFENFIIGGSNRFAHAAAVAVAETPARLQPPLYLWRLGARQNAPAPRDRPLRAGHVPGHQGSVRLERRVHERLHQLDLAEPLGGVPPALPQQRHPSHR
jgi:chromosomal replication initiator protein